MIKKSVLGVLVALVFSTVGCDGTPAPQTADPAEARRTLDSALEAWKGGKTVEEMKNASPSIVVADPKWERGSKLSKFQVETVGDGTPSGAERTFTVTLWVADAKGKEAREEVVYRVGTRPIFTVFRSLF